MKIFMTNDDGILSPGITLLAAALRNKGHRVVLLAPDVNRSGISHAITFLNGPCKIEKTGEDSWSCAGTPADCVIIALLGGIPGMKEFFPDLVLSGINRGANLGTDIVYSGTAAAARQASLHGIPSIALSLLERDNAWHWEPAVNFFIEKLQFVCDFWKKDTFVNINFPNMPSQPAGFIPSFPAKRCYTDTIELYQSPQGDYYCFADGGKIGAKNEALSDYDTVSGNNASISAVYIHPVSIDEIVQEKGKI